MLMAADPLEQAILEALRGSHRHLARVHGRAWRYREEVAPFAAVEEQSPEAMRELCALLEPGQAVHLLGPKPPEVAGLRLDGVLRVLQMVFPENAALPVVPEVQIEELDCRNAQEMVDLIAVAYPGYFRPQTCRMGRYFGVRDESGTLVAMGGERLVIGRWHEVSGLAAHPDQRGKGLGTAVLRRVLAAQRENGQLSWLHVSESNRSAIELYERLGFEHLRCVELHRVERTEDA